MNEPFEPDQPREPAAIAPAEVDIHTGTRRRVSWGAIFVGGLVALSLQLMLNLLGVGIGFAIFEPGGDAPGSGLAIGSVVWWALSGFAALFVGGAVAGRLAGSPKHTDGALHGIAVWALSTVVVLWLVASSVGTLVSSTLGVVGAGVSTAASAAASNLPQITDEIDRRVDLDRDTWATVEAELREILRQTGSETLQPENIEARAERAAEDARESARAAATSPERARSEVTAAVRRVTRLGGELVDAADEEAAVNVLAARTDMSKEEAQRTIDRWQSQFEDAEERLGQWTDRARQATVEAAGEASDYAAGAAFAAFFVMLIGAAASGIGGATGAPPEHSSTVRSRSRS